MDKVPARTELAFLAAITAIAVLHAWPALWTAVDDAFVSARYAEHLAMGHGWTWNAAGPAVEGFSNPLWTAWIAVGVGVGADVHRWMVGWGLVGLVAALPGAWLLARALADEPDAGALIAPMAIALSPLCATAATNGLETAWFLAAVLWTAWGTLTARTPATELSVGVGLGLLAWIRPEGLLAAPVWLVVRWLRGEEIRWLAGGWLAPVALLLGWRLATFGTWLPNTAGAKVGAFGPGELARRNLRYLGHYGPLAPGLLLVGGFAVLRSPRDPARLATAAVAIALTLPALSVELWMPGWRLLQPAVGLVCALLGAIACGTRGRWLAALVLAGLPLLAEPRARARDTVHSVLPDNGAARAGRWLRRHAPDHASLAIRDAGVLAAWAGPAWTVTETHERALTRPHPGGAPLPHGAPANPTVVVLTQAREDARGIRYANDRALFESLDVPYVFLGRVYQHHHRYYDLFARVDAGLPPLPPEIVVAPDASR